MLNPIAGKRGGAIAKELSAIIKNPGCYFPHRREVEDAIGWLTGEEMAIDKANLIDRLDWARSPEAVSVSPDGLPGLLLEAIELLESPSKIPLKKNIFVKIDVNSWSVDEPFITDHKPATKEEMSLKKIVYRLISDGEIDDFYCPTIHPSYEGCIGIRHHHNRAYEDDYTTTPGNGVLFFEKSCKPFADGVDYTWWERVAESFMPGNSRIGCVNEYRIFCAFLIRNLINKKNWPINEAWGAICNGKPKLPKDVFGFRNLDRYCKVLAGRCGGLRDYCLGGGYSNPIAEIDIPSTCASPQLFNGVGWIICERDPMKPVA